MGLEKEISVWDKTLAAIKEQVDEKSFNMWFKPLKCVSSDRDVLNIEAPSQLFADWINKNYREVIDKGLSSGTDQKIKIEFSVRREVQSKQKSKKQGPSLFDSRHTGFSIRLNPNYTFDKFVVGGGNQFAHAAALGAFSPARRRRK